MEIMVGVTTIWGTVLKGCSVGKVENQGSRLAVPLPGAIPVLLSQSLPRVSCKVPRSPQSVKVSIVWL